jgi:CBS domain-containing protein
MQVTHLMTRQIQCSAPQDSLERAAHLMWDHDCGCLPVCAGSGHGQRRIVGVITDRDICMCALFQHKALFDLSVGDAMTKQVLSCKPSDTVEHVEKLMRDGRVRRLPVLDAEGMLLGMISLADLARAAHGFIDEVAQNVQCLVDAADLGDRAAARKSVDHGLDISESEVSDTLAAICASPARSPNG